MSKTTTAGMDTHLQQEVTSLATCWRITRTDGVEFFFTDHDVDVSFDGNIYVADTGYKRSAIQNDATMAVDNLDIEGVFDSAQITEQDLRAGLFDYAQIRIFIVNWTDLTDSDIKMRNGRLGEVTLTEQGIFRAELRGLTQALSQTIGKLYQPECRADLGDDSCKVPIQPDLRIDSTSYSVGDFIRVNTVSPSPLSGVRLLVPADTDADDVSPFEAVSTLGSQAAVQEITKKFGAGSIEFSPSGSVDPSQAFVSYPDSANYSLGSEDFTIEGWVRFKDLTSSFQVFAAQFSETGIQRAWYIGRDGATLRAFFSDDGTGVAPAFSFTGAVTWAIDTQYHVAVTREGNTFRLFMAGVLVATTTSSIVIHNSTAVLTLGKFRAATSGDDSPFDGFLDDWRITVGTARYTATFAPPTEAFPAELPISFQDDYENRIYECTTAGTTASFAPTYDTTVGNTTTDGTVVFTAREAWQRHATVDTVTDRKILTLSVTGWDETRDVDDWFNGGALAFEDGDNTGKVIEIRDWVQTGRSLTLFLPTPFDIAPGTAVRLYPGCDKRSATCIAKFVLGSVIFANGNIKNFRGEPFVPGQDELTRYPDAKSG